MNKELTPLEALNELFDIAYDKVRSGWEDKPLERKLFVLNDIIKKALNQLEKNDKVGVATEISTTKETLEADDDTKHRQDKKSNVLERLNRIKNHFNPKDIANKELFNEDFDTIEAELKDKELQDDGIKVLKEVIAFGLTLPHIEPNKDNGFDIWSAVGINIQRDIENRERELLRQWVLETCFPKELKALKIIKEKEVDIWLLKHCDYENYCRIRKLCLENTGNADKCVDCDKEIINLPTEDEFNELKEVLK